MTPFQVGDKVKFLNAVGGGIVKRITADMVYVEDETGFDMPFAPNELIRMADQQGVGKVFNTDPLPTAAKVEKKDLPISTPPSVNDTPSASDLAEENRRLRSQNANLHDQIKQLKSQVLSLQRTLARMS